MACWNASRLIELMLLTVMMVSSFETVRLECRNRRATVYSRCRSVASTLRQSRLFARYRTKMNDHARIAALEHEEVVKRAPKSRRNIKSLRCHSDGAWSMLWLVNPCSRLFEIGRLPHRTGVLRFARGPMSAFAGRNEPDPDKAAAENSEFSSAGQGHPTGAKIVESPSLTLFCRFQRHAPCKASIDEAQPMQGGGGSQWTYSSAVAVPACSKPHVAVYDPTRSTDPVTHQRIVARLSTTSGECHRANAEPKQSVPKYPSHDSLTESAVKPAKCAS